MRGSRAPQPSTRMSEHGKATLACPVQVSPTFVTELSGGQIRKQGRSENCTGHGGQLAAAVAPLGRPSSEGP